MKALELFDLSSKVAMISGGGDGTGFGQSAGHCPADSITAAGNHRHLAA